MHLFLFAGQVSGAHTVHPGLRSLVCTECIEHRLWDRFAERRPQSRRFPTQAAIEAKQSHSNAEPLHVTGNLGDGKTLRAFAHNAMHAPCHLDSEYHFHYHEKVNAIIIERFSSWNILLLKIFFAVFCAWSVLKFLCLCMWSVFVFAFVFVCELALSLSLSLYV